MAKQVSYGSSGSDVKKLQQLLNSYGNYGLATDGVFGAKTQAAVKDYQKKNGLTVDGIAGVNTWNSVLGKSTAKTATSTKPAAASTAKISSSSSQKTNLAGVSDYTASNLSKYEQGYTPSETVKKAQSYLEEVTGSKPSPFKSTFEDQLNDIYSKIMNRKDFEYDLNGDMLYQQMKDQYQVLGKTAMQDTMGQAAALTGGYGNTYAQNVGQQAYNSYLQKLNDNIPDLYRLALEKYNAEGDKLLEQYQLTGDRYDDEYSKYQDAYNQWLAERDYANSRYDSERNFDYGNFTDMLSYWQGQAANENQNYWQQKDYDYQQEQFKYQKEQDAIANALAKQKASGGSGRSSGSGSSKSSSSYDVNKMNKIYDTISKLYAASGGMSKGMGLNTSAYNAVEKFVNNLIATGELNELEARGILSRYR